MERPLSEFQELLNACFAPSFIISLAGPNICICGTIFLGSPIVQRLTDYIWLANSRIIDDENVLRIARILWALKNALHRLRQYYAELTQPANVKMRFYPLATKYKDGARTVSFEYLDFLRGPGEACVTFLAREVDAPARKVVVKFVERYGEAAHRHLAAAGLAPTLLYYGDIWLSGPEQQGCGTRKMVVMKYIEGKTAAGYREIPNGVQAAVRRAVQLLHTHTPPLVHGDIRLPNIIIADGAEGESLEDRIKIVDFDWAGTAGEVRYPFNLSSKIRWPTGVADHALILPAHDIEMVDRLAA